MRRVFVLAALVACAPEEDVEAVCDVEPGAGLDPVTLGGCEPTLATEPLPTRTSVINGVTVHEDLYMATRGDHALHADLHLPDNMGQPGALVVVHGGGWLDCANRRQQVDYYAQAVAEVLRIPTFRIDYRLVQEGGGYPHNVMDVKCGVQWLRAHADEYGIDGDRIGIMGTSAGAHLAAMVAMTEDRADLDPQCGELPPEVVITLAYSGPFDLPTFTDGPSVARDAPLYYTEEDCDVPAPACGEDGACSRCVDASPITHVCDADDDPIVLFQAPDPMDEFVPEGQASGFAAALQDVGVPVQLVIPTADQMAAAGCPAGSMSHGADLCMLNATGTPLNEALTDALGAR